MSDEDNGVLRLSPQNPKPFAASQQDLVEFAGLFEPKCWCCGTNTWSLLTLDDKPAISLYGLAMAQFKLHLPTYTMVCENCGTVWAIQARTVEEWIDNGKPKKGKAE